MEKYDILIVGLGNPGEQYNKTRHNFGWFVVESLAKQGMFNPWKQYKKGLRTSGELFSRNVLLLKPTTMMNLSGEAIAETNSIHKPTHVICVHDDLDIEFSKIKSKIGGSSGGHNGVQSIIQALGHEKFHRIRCGIGRPIDGNDVINHVLGEFTNDENILLPEIIQLTNMMIQNIIMNLEKK